jgi:putative endonuclease
MGVSGRVGWFRLIGDCHAARSGRLAMTSPESFCMNDRQYCVYIMTNAHNTVLYTGVTNNLMRRVGEHRAGNGNFTKRYIVTKLVYYECGDDINIAITREKQIKAGSRQKKIDLINSMNPEWKDLYEEFFV